MAPVNTGAFYGHLFNDSPDDCLFIRTLASGHACQTQLVRNSTTGSVCVRKALCDARSLSGQDRAVQEFHRDVRVASRLLAIAAAEGYEARIPKLLFASSPAPFADTDTDTDASGGSGGGSEGGSGGGSNGGGDGGSNRVSYWNLCNGGTLFAFLARCQDTGARLPIGLALHILQQTLETLEFMYTAPHRPVFHQDLHQSNLMLHFSPGRALPDVYIIDFGRAGSVDGDDPDLDPRLPQGMLPWWDVKSVLRLLQHSLIPRAASPSSSAAASSSLLAGAASATAATVKVKRMSTGDNTKRRYQQRMHPYSSACAHHKRSSDDDARANNNDTNNNKDTTAADDITTDPLQHALKMLEALNIEFMRGVIKAVQQARQSQAQTTSSNSEAMPARLPQPPSLAKVIKFVRRASKARVVEERFGEEHAHFRREVLGPARERAERVGGMKPVLGRSVEGLLEWLEAVGKRGPWDVAEVDPESGGVKRVMRAQVRSGRVLEEWERLVDGVVAREEREGEDDDGEDGEEYEEELW